MILAGIVLYLTAPERPRTAAGGQPPLRATP